MFITFEGGEGSGKSTQIALLARALEQAGKKIVLTREPGGTEGAERIRTLLVEGKADAWDAEAETLLFYAARLEHWRGLIAPALARGAVVLCDRFYDSTFVYQGVGKHVPAAYIEQLHRLTLGNAQPDLTLIFDLPPEEGLKRAGARKGNETRFESLDLSFHQAVRSGFLVRAHAAPERCVVVDASGSVEQVAARVREAVRERVGL